MNRDRLLNLMMGVLTLCALLITGLVIHREFFGAPVSALPQPRLIPEWRSFAQSGHWMGPESAAVTIVEFSDFQCPFCGALAARLRRLREAYPDDVAIVYRHFPLDSHPYAVPAVRASECAAAQGRFAAFHDALFAAQDSLGRVPWTRFAAAAGVPDLSAFRRCAAATGAIAALERDTLAGNRLGVVATPTLLINDMRFQGALPMAVLETYVRRALRGEAAR